MVGGKRQTLSMMALPGRSKHRSRDATVVCGREDFSPTETGRILKGKSEANHLSEHDLQVVHVLPAETN